MNLEFAGLVPQPGVNDKTILLVEGFCDLPRDIFGAFLQPWAALPVDLVHQSAVACWAHIKNIYKSPEPPPSYGLAGAKGRKEGRRARGGGATLDDPGVCRGVGHGEREV